jgi:hypothetical protein
MNGLDMPLRRWVYWLVPMAALAFLIGVETDWLRGLHPVPPSESPVAPPPLAAAVLPDYAPPSAPAELVSRTLFTPTRRPAPAALAEGAKPLMQRGQFVLSGTLVVDGKATVLLRETAPNGKPRRVAQGETINGMLVAAVKPDRVTLKLGDETEELVLKVATNSRPTPQPAAAAPGGSAPAAAAPGAPAVAGAAAGSETAAVMLAERRRAAQQAQAAGGTATAPGAPVPPVAPAAAAVDPAAAQANAAPADPRWQEVYQRYQQRAAQNAPQK